jgi:hypothetical protein
MTWVLVVLAVTVAPAAAEPRRPNPPSTLPIVMLPRVDPPIMGWDCAAVPSVVRVSRVAGTSRVTAIHDCSPEEPTRLAIETAEGWFVSPLATTRFDHTFTDARYIGVLDREDLQEGRLFDGTRAIVHSIEVLHVQPRPVLHGAAQVCSVEREIACSMVVTFECGENGCTAPTLSRGRLTIVDARRGTQQFVLNRVTRPEPKR